MKENNGARKIGLGFLRKVKDRTVGQINQNNLDETKQLFEFMHSLDELSDEKRKSVTEAYRNGKMTLKDALNSIKKNLNPSLENHEISMEDNEK